MISRRRAPISAAVPPQLLICALSILMTAVVLTAGGADAAMQFHLRPRGSEAAAVPKNSEAVVSQLIRFFENEPSFGVALATWSSETGGSGNYCRIVGLVCNEAHTTLIKIELRNVTGRLTFSHLPKGVESITISHGSFDSRADFTNVPYWLNSISIEDTSFSEPTLSFHSKHPGLQSFKCIRCGLRSVDWSTLPNFLTLDLSLNNELAAIDAPIPSTLQVFNISGNNISQSLSSLGALPPSLQRLDVSGNRLHGRLDRIKLPPYLNFLNMSANHLSGDVNGDELPMFVSTIDLSSNKFDGVVMKFKTMTALSTLILSHNSIQHIFWEDLPEQLTWLDASDNELAGKLDWKKVPPSIEKLFLAHNKLSGALDFGEVFRTVEDLDLSHNSFSGKVDLTRIPDTMRFVYLGHNLFTGRPDLTMLPVDLRRIMINGNPWEKDLPVEMQDL